MEETRNTSAIILDRQPYREADVLVTAYTRRFGKLRLIARGAKKPRSKLAGHLEPISCADLMIVSGRHLDYVGAAASLDSYFGIRKDLNKLYFAGQAVAGFSYLVKENQAEERLFFLLAQWLGVLDGYEADPEKGGLNRSRGELLLVFFLWKLLGELGYRPEMSRCLRCHELIRSGGNYFDLIGGGVIDNNCADIKKKEPLYRPAQLLTISDNSFKMIRYIMDEPFPKAPRLVIPKKDIKEMLNITRQFIQFINN